MNSEQVQHRQPPPTYDQIDAVTVVSNSLAYAQRTLEDIRREDYHFPAQEPTVQVLLEWTRQKRIDYYLFKWCSKIIKRDGELKGLINAHLTLDSQKAAPLCQADRRTVEQELVNALEERAIGFNYLHDHNWNLIVTELRKEKIVRASTALLSPSACLLTFPSLFQQFELRKDRRRGSMVSLWSAADFLGRLRRPRISSLRQLEVRFPLFVSSPLEIYSQKSLHFAFFWIHQDPLAVRIAELKEIYRRIERQPGRHRLTRPFAKDWVEKVEGRLKDRYKADPNLLLDLQSWARIEEGLWVATHHMRSITLEVSSSSRFAMVILFDLTL